MISMIFKVIAWLALVILILSAIWFLSGRWSLDSVKTILLVSTVVWFLFAYLGQKVKCRCHCDER